MTLPASWDESWFGSPAVFDLDGNGTPEIIAGCHSVLYVWDSKGKPIWRAPVGAEGSLADLHGSFRQYAGPVVGDFNGDGKGEIAIAYDNKAIIYDATGKIRAGWPQPFPGPAGEIRSLTAADLDDDGEMEILAMKTSAGPVTVAWKLNGGIAPGWPQTKGCEKCNDYGGYHQNIGAADLDGDGKPEVVSAYDMAYIGIMHGTGAPFPSHTSFSEAGPWASSVPMFHDILFARRGWGAVGNDRDEFTHSPPVFGDLDGDGLPEIILYSDHEKAGEYLIRGNCLWALNPDMTRVAGFEKPLCSDAPLFTGFVENIVQVAPSPALVQLRGDARPEIIVPSYDGLMRCYGPDGKLLWEYRFDTAGGDTIGASGAVAGDLDKDGIPEIVFTTYSPVPLKSHLIVLDAAGKELHKAPLSKRGCMGAPTLADVDGDHRPEIILGLKDAVGSGLGAVQIWDVAGAGDALLPWPTGRGNTLRTGQGPKSVSTRMAGATRPVSAPTKVNLARSVWPFRHWFRNLLGAQKPSGVTRRGDNPPVSD